MFNDFDITEMQSDLIYHSKDNYNLNIFPSILPSEYELAPCPTNPIIPEYLGLTIICPLNLFQVVEVTLLFSLDIVFVFKSYSKAFGKECYDRAQSFSKAINKLSNEIYLGYTEYLNKSTELPVNKTSFKLYSN